MNDLTEQEILDAAFEQVLNHPSFQAYTREELSSCDNFCEMIRQAPHEHVVQLMAALEEIALATDDHNEASGVLLVCGTFGGGLKKTPEVEQALAEFADIPVADTELFCDWVISIPEDERKRAYTAAMDAICKHGIKIRDGNPVAKLGYHQVNVVLHYSLCPLDDLLETGNYANDNLNTDLHIREQIPGRLWEVFNSRPSAEVSKLLTHWWGGRSSIPNDFFIALEWQRQGYIEIHKGKKYLETVAEFLLHSCEPNYGIAALKLDQFLADELYAGLMEKAPYRWLISHDIDKRAEYLNTLFAAGALKREPILAALEHGIASQWHRHFMKEFKTLRDKISL